MALHVFNPENDLALACFSPHFIPPRSARKMANDLSALPVWWARPGDAVWVDSLSDIKAWEKNLQGFSPQVEWVDFEHLSGMSEVIPWGWSPLLVHRMKVGGVPEKCLPDDSFLLRYRESSNRCHAVEILKRLCGKESELERRWGYRLCGVSYYCTDEATIARLLSEYSETILKAPWSGSGKGLRLGRGSYEAPLSGWCSRLLREQGGVVVEPLYHKVSDFALEFFMEADGRVIYKGLSLFLTSNRGTYEGNCVADESIKEQWLTSLIPDEMLDCLKKELSAALTRQLGGNYTGPLGVDMMLCREPGKDELCVHPCVEINLRRTMGWVSLEMNRLLVPGVEARFVIDYNGQEGMLLEEHNRYLSEYPLQMEGGRLQSGYLALTPVTKHTCYRATLWVGKNKYNTGWKQ